MIAVFSAALLVGAVAHAEGNTGGAFSDPGTGARALSLGNAFVAVADDVYAITANPAGLAQLDMASVTFDFADVFDLGLIKQSFLGAAFPTRWGVHGIHYRGTRFGFDPFPQKLNETTLGYSFGRYFGPVAVGTTIKYFNISSDFDQGDADGFGFDLGARYQVTDRWSLGLSFQNLLSTLQFGTGTDESLPISWRFGSAFRVSDRWLVTGEIAGLSGEPINNLRVGTEYWLIRPSTSRKVIETGESIFRRAETEGSPFGLAFRAGLDNRQGENSDLQGAIGTSLAYRTLRFDYAFLFGGSNDLGSTHRYTLSFDFKPWSADVEEDRAQQEARDGRVAPTPVIPPSERRPAREEPSEAPVETPFSRKRILVLDFANATGNAELNWLEKGYADIVVSRLQSRRLLVVPRTAHEGLSALSGPQIQSRAKELGAGVVVRGLYASESGGRVSLSARLVDVLSGRTVDRVTVTGSQDDIFALGRELADLIVARAEQLL